MLQNDLKQLRGLYAEIKNIKQIRLPELNKKLSGAEEERRDEIRAMIDILENRVKRLTAQKERAERFIAEIPDEYTRGIFESRYIYGRSWTELGVMYGQNSNTVARSVQRYIKKHSAEYEAAE